MDKNNKEKQPRNSYSLKISILLGLVGFIGSFYSSRYGFNEFSINIIWSLILPILVVLAWGMQYGLLSITFGLTALYPFFLGRYNGWASLIPSMALYLLVFMHGYGHKKRKESHSLLFNLYIIQGVYSVLRILLYILFFPLLISANPPFWNPLAYTEVTREIVLLFAIKGVVVEFILVALGDALLLLPFVQKFFRLTSTKASRANTRIMAALVLFGMSFTFLVLALNQYISQGYISIAMLFQADDFVRSTFLLTTILFVIMGGITVRYVEKMLDVQEALKKRETQYKLVNLEIKLLNESLEQRVLQRTEELLDLNLELEEFAYSISHDLKAPLRAIEGYGEFLVLDHRESLDEEALEMVETIRSISNNMMGLISRLLEYSTMAKKELWVERVNLFSIAEEVVVEFRVANPERTIQLHLSGDNIEIIGDRILLRQMIQNLFSNAVKFSKMNQETIIRIHGEEKIGDYCLEFKDEGVGFESKDKERVFGIFQKFHPPSKYEGYGIGLSTVKKIVVKHGGQVAISSRKDEGTTVTLTLPLKRREEKIHV